MTFPLISCLCVTEARVPFLQRSIQCFQDQTYPNKEMVIVYPANDLATHHYLQEQRISNVQASPIPEGMHRSLGEKRNFSIQCARGAYICQWDDDDWYPIERLERQLSFVMATNVAAVALSHIIIYNVFNSSAYLSFERHWENTLLCAKQAIEGVVSYPSMDKSEDTVFVEQLLDKKLLACMDQVPLYIYINHGNNTWSRNHFEMLCSMSKPLSNMTSQLVSEIVDGKYDGEHASELLQQRIAFEFASCGY